MGIFGVWETRTQQADDPFYHEIAFIMMTDVEIFMYALGASFPGSSSPPPFPPQQTCLTLNSPLPLPRPTGRPRPRRPPPQLQFLLLGALHPQFLSRHQPNQRHGGRQPRRAGGQPFIQQAAARQRDIAHERRPLLQTLTFE